MPKGRGRKESKTPKRRLVTSIEHRAELTTVIPSQEEITTEDQTSPTLSTTRPSTLDSNYTSHNYPMSYCLPYQQPGAMYRPYFAAPFLSPTSMYLGYYSGTSSPSSQDDSSFHLFRVHFISGNISVYNGCKNKYQKSGPPDDICLQHKEWRIYTPQGSSTPQRRFGNVYYHCSVACVQSSWPSFSPASVIVPEDINCKLLAVHKHLLNFNLGLFIP